VIHHFDGASAVRSRPQWAGPQSAIMTSKRLPIHEAAIANDLIRLQKDLDKGVDIDTKDPTDMNSTALHHAIWTRHLGAVKFLVKSKANVNQVDDTKTAPLMFACRQSHEGVVKFLIDMHADVNQANEDGETPLMFAAEYQFETMVHMLLVNKADVTAKGSGRRFHGQTALDIAKFRNHRHVVDVLSVQPAPPAPPAPIPSGDTPLTPLPSGDTPLTPLSTALPTALPTA
jgi:ankyrin repeat protein